MRSRKFHHFPLPIEFLIYRMLLIHVILFLRDHICHYMQYIFVELDIKILRIIYKKDSNLQWWKICFDAIGHIQQEQLEMNKCLTFFPSSLLSMFSLLFIKLIGLILISKNLKVVKTVEMQAATKMMMGKGNFIFLLCILLVRSLCCVSLGIF